MAEMLKRGAKLRVGAAIDWMRDNPGKVLIDHEGYQFRWNGEYQARNLHGVRWYPADMGGVVDDGEDLTVK